MLLSAVLVTTFAIVPTVDASCARPTARLLESRAAPGDEISLTGRYWATECHDAIVCSPGCFGTRCTGDDPSPFARGLAVEIRRDRPDADWREIAAGIDAGPGYRIATGILLPQDVTPGRYDVRVRGNGLEVLIPDGLAVAVDHR